MRIAQQNYCQHSFGRFTCLLSSTWFFFFFFQAEDGIRDYKVTRVQTCALPICKPAIVSTGMSSEGEITESVALLRRLNVRHVLLHCNSTYPAPFKDVNLRYIEIGRASCRERV